jgi:hypothetical protein
VRKRTALVALFIALAMAGGYFEPTAEAQIPNASQAQTWTCSLDNIGATLTLCIQAPSDPTVTRYLTYVVAQSTTTTAGQFILRYGTGTNCATGTVSLLPSAATAARIAAPANTAAATVIALPSALKIPPGNDLCVLGVATNTFTGQLGGYVGPQ